MTKGKELVVTLVKERNRATVLDEEILQEVHDKLCSPKRQKDWCNNIREESTSRIFTEYKSKEGTVLSVRASKNSKERWVQYLPIIYMRY